MHTKTQQPESEFYKKYRGSFTSVLKWPQLDEFWQNVKAKAHEEWYIYQIGESLPETYVTPEQLTKFVDEIDPLIRKEHQEEYCGIVYADNLSEPTFIKIYDPNNLGVVCGFSDNPPLPGWVLSQLKPESLDENTFSTQSRKRWWRRLFSD